MRQTKIWDSLRLRGTVLLIAFLLVGLATTPKLVAQLSQSKLFANW